MVMGHSLGEYGALVAAGALTFDSALEAVSARGHEMASLSMDDNGAMAAVFGPLAEIERIVDGGRRLRRHRQHQQQQPGRHRRRHRGGRARDRVRCEAAGLNAARIPVSHAFHTSIVAPASEPLKVALRRLDVRAPVLPIVANVTGDFYPAGADTEAMLDMLGRQVASPVQFVRACTRCTTPVRASSSRSARRRRCTASSRTCSARATTTCSRCSPTTRRTATCRRSTRRCAACAPPVSAIRRRQT